ncbi:hypothetical protein MFUM_310001 [Methylacidiphilum fumariolicum SolV]|uniref:Uncharacterized protein n=2 Tax=Candidatus Methylacidiphilum fumarolicum TaxID=591154 RepID=I0JXW2_METFB|nr:conserved protein of unknown function [Candidatus Methylacidiphilum fumarolicum]CCG92081.1 hypothetical protein MFUM_310001 [Methylacidiphilum fumariolicum SolV]
MQRWTSVIQFRLLANAERDGAMDIDGSRLDSGAAAGRSPPS